jgi:hypothetical protein
MSDLGNQVERILKDEAFLSVLDSYRTGLTNTVMEYSTTPEKRAEALSLYHGLTGLVQALYSEASNADKETK